MLALYSNRFPLHLEIGVHSVTARAHFEYKETIKAAGFRWNAPVRKWQMPIDYFRKNIDAIAGRLTLDPGLVQEYKSGNRWRSFYSPHAVIIPNASRYQYQNDGIKHALFHRYCIIGDEMGLGKSFQGLGVIESAFFAWERERPALVLCPAFLKLNWKTEIERWLPGFVPVVLESKTPPAIITQALANPFSVFVLNYEIMAKFSQVFEQCKVWIVDECQALKNPEANRTKNFADFLDKFRPDYLTMLTGTAATNSIVDFFSLLLFCSAGSRYAKKVSDNINYSSFYRFGKYFAHERETKFGSKFFGIKNYSELRELLDGNYLRRSASEFLDLPPIVRQRFTVSADPKLLAEHDAGLLAAYQQMIGVPPEAQAQAAISSAKRGAALLKTSGTIALAEEILAADDEQQIVIFTDHRMAGHTITEALKGAFIQGETPMDERQKMVEKFQSGTIRVLVATIGAAKTGLTLTAANQMIFNDLPWVPGDYLQAEKRIHRIGQTERCVIHIAMAAGIDTMITKKVLEKARDLSAVLGMGNETAVDF